jgi:hypothetical protein
MLQVNAPQIIGVTLEQCREKAIFFLHFWQYNLIGNVESVNVNVLF